MLTIWIARKDCAETKYFTFNRLNDVEYSRAINWRIDRTLEGYTVRVKIN